MSQPNLFWNVYKSLERELLDLSRTIHIDNKQINTYSTRIADLLVRTAVEIEAISKQLYRDNGGTLEQPFFDTDCLEELNNKWNITEKIVDIHCPMLYLKNEISLQPLKKANKRGSSGSKWKQAYMAVKHDRANSLAEGSLKNFIHALAALFILNIYYKNETFNLGSDEKGNTFDTTLKSDVFAVRLYKNELDNKKEECIYVLQGGNSNKSTFDKITAIILSRYLAEPNTQRLEELRKEPNKVTKEFYDILNEIRTKGTIIEPYLGGIKNYKGNKFVHLTQEEVVNIECFDAILNKENI